MGKYSGDWRKGMLGARELEELQRHGAYKVPYFPKAWECLLGGKALTHYWPGEFSRYWCLWWPVCLHKWMLKHLHFWININDYFCTSFEILVHVLPKLLKLPLKCDRQYSRHLCAGEHTSATNTPCFTSPGEADSTRSGGIFEFSRYFPITHFLFHLRVDKVGLWEGLF